MPTCCITSTWSARRSTRTTSAPRAGRIFAPIFPRQRIRCSTRGACWGSTASAPAPTRRGSKRSTAKRSSSTTRLSSLRAHAMAIHEKSLIRPENLKVQDHRIVDGIDVSGHWSTFIETRVVKDYNEALEEEISSLPGGEFIHRCWQCGSCTNACTVNALNPDFNPRFWIYLIRMGLESELLRDKDIIWQCVSCNKCTSACPRDVVPEGVMKATAHWLELKGHTKPSPSTIFDDVFTEQVVKTG